MWCTCIGLCVRMCNALFGSQICLLAVIQEALLQEGSLDRLVVFDIRNLVDQLCNLVPCFTLELSDEELKQQEEADSSEEKVV